MGFEKGNQFGKYTKRGKGKKTIIKESLSNLEKAGIKPFDITQELLNGLVHKTDRSIQEQELIFKIVSSLYKYDSLTKAEEHQLTTLHNEVQEIKQQQMNVATTTELLSQLKTEIKND